MAASLITVANAALTALGESRISALPPADTSEPARLVAERIDDVIDAVLVEHPWNSALARASLPALAEAPAFDFSHQYVLPTDPWCLRVWRVGTADDWAHHVWVVEGRRLLATYPPPAPVTYVRRVEAMAELSPHVREVIAARLAAELCRKIVDSGTFAEQLWQGYERRIAAARAIDGQESGRRRVPVDTYLRSRSVAPPPLPGPRY